LLARNTSTGGPKKRGEASASLASP